MSGFSDQSGLANQIVPLALVLGIVVVATLVPAWRAARINPLRALRHQ